MTQVVDLFWDRFYLCVELDSADDGVLLRNGSTICEPLRFADDPDNIFRFNVANAGDRSLLGRGEWFVSAREQGAVLAFSDDVLLKVESLSKPFFFSRFNQAFIVRFQVRGEVISPMVSLVVDYFKSDKNPKSKRSVVSIGKKGLAFCYRCLRLVSPKHENRVLFMSENNNQMTGNLKAIYDRMVERGLDKEFDISLSFRNIFSKHTSLFSWLKTLSKIARSKYIFIEDYSPIFAAINLDKKTELIQVWHAGFGFKAVGFGRFGIEGSPNPFASCHRKYTYALVGNSNLREIYSEVFGIEKEALLSTGMPRLDGFLDSDRISDCRTAFCERHPSFESRRVVLFAPTYRGADQRSAYYDYTKIDFPALHEMCKETDSAVVFKMHRFVREQVPIPGEFSDLIVDESNYSIESLYYSADVLVTDYSSCFYDYLLLNRPVVFYCYDEAYYEATRGVHRHVSEVAPGPVCHSFDELVSVLNRGCAAPNKSNPMLIDKHFEDAGYSACDSVIDIVLLGRRDDDICLR